MEAIDGFGYHRRATAAATDCKELAIGEYDAIHGVQAERGINGPSNAVGRGNRRPTCTDSDENAVPVSDRVQSVSLRKTIGPDPRNLSQQRSGQHMKERGDRERKHLRTEEDERSGHGWKEGSRECVRHKGKRACAAPQLRGTIDPRTPALEPESKVKRSMREWH